MSKPPAKRGRPQGSTSAAKSQVSNANGKKTGSSARSRSTRSDRNSLAESPFVNGLEPKKRGRKISGPQATGSDVSDSESGESDAGSLGRRSSKRLSKHDTSVEDLDTSIEEERDKDEGPGFDEDELGPSRVYESLEDADVIDDRKGRPKPSKKVSPLKARMEGSEDEGNHGNSDDDMKKVTDTKPIRRSRGRPSKHHTVDVKEELKGGVGKDTRKAKTKKPAEDDVGDDEDIEDMSGKTVSDILQRIGLDKDEDDDDDDDDLSLPMKPSCSLDDWKENSRLFATSDHQYSDPTKDLDDLKIPSTGPDSPKESEHIEVVIKQAADENDAMLDQVVAVIANQSGSSDAIAISFPSEMGVIIAKGGEGDLDGIAEVEAPKLAAETEVDGPMPSLEKEMPPDLLLDSIPTLEMETPMFESTEETTAVENDDEKTLSIAQSPPKEEIYVVIGELTAPAIIHEVPVISPVCERNETTQDDVVVVNKTEDIMDGESCSMDVDEPVNRGIEVVKNEAPPASSVMGDDAEEEEKEEEEEEEVEVEKVKALEVQNTSDRIVDPGNQPSPPALAPRMYDVVELPQLTSEAKSEEFVAHSSESNNHDAETGISTTCTTEVTLNDQSACPEASVDSQEDVSNLEVVEGTKISTAVIPEVSEVLTDIEKPSVVPLVESTPTGSWNDDIIPTEQVQKIDNEMLLPNECENLIEEEACISTAAIEALTAPSSDTPIESSHCRGSKKDRRRQKGKRLEKRRSMDVADESSDETGVEDEPRAKKKKNRDERMEERFKEFQGKGDSKSKKSREKRSKSSKKGDSDRDESRSLKKKGSSWKARRKECKKKKESSEKDARSHKMGDERMDSDDVSSQSSDGSLKRKGKKSKKHSKVGDKGRESPTEGQTERRKYLSSKRSKASSESGSPSEGHTSDDGHWESSSKKIRKEERSKRDKKRKDKSKKKSNSGDDSDSSIGRTVVSPEKTVMNVEQKASEVGDSQVSLFLMCEERVPASPLAVEDVASNFPSEERPSCASKDAPSPLLLPEVSSAPSLIAVTASGPSVSVLSFESTVAPKVKAEPQPPATTSTALLDNTPPTTPESAELDSSPPPCRERGITLVSPSHDASDSTASGSKSNQGSCQDDYAPSTGTSFDRLLATHKFLQPDTGGETGHATAVLPKRPKSETEDQTSKKKNKKSHRKQGSLEIKPSSSASLVAAAPSGTRQRQNSSKTVKGV